MTDQPIVTVVIPTRNRAPLLKETIASVYSQTFRRWELIVVDDASVDETWPWLQGLAGDTVRPIRLEEHGERSRARNVGLRAAQGGYVLFLDDDDLLPERALHTHVEALHANHAAIASIGGYVLFGEGGYRRPVRIIGHPVVRRIEKELLFGWMATGGHSLFRTELVRSLGGWNESRHLVCAEDHDLWLRMAPLGPVALSPEIVLGYRVHGQPRPANLEERLIAVRRSVVERLHGTERRVSERILHARTLAQRARATYKRGETLKALLLYLGAAWSGPELLRSPLTRGTLSRAMIRCCVGNQGLRLVQRPPLWLRAQLRRGSRLVPRRIQPTAHE